MVSKIIGNTADGLKDFQVPNEIEDPLNNSSIESYYEITDDENDEEDEKWRFVSLNELC